MQRPDKNEYGQWFAGYINHVPKGDIFKLLDSTAKKTVKVFAAIPEEKGNYSYAEGKWTIKQLLQHIIDTERIMNYRALAFARKEDKSLPGFDENLYAENAPATERSIKDLLEEFKVVRKSSILLYKSFSEAQSAYSGTANNNPLSVRSIVYITVGHVLHHLRILEERYLNQ